MSHVVIADTSALFSLASETDTNHALSVAEGEKLFKTDGSVIIPTDVFTETINIMGKKADHTSALRTAHILLNEPAYVIVDTDEPTRQLALEKFQKQNEDVSFTDCMVMAVADKFKTKAIFGLDKVFRDNGYTALVGK
jgi:predicted nucleic acid-binding protein